MVTLCAALNVDRNVFVGLEGLKEHGVLDINSDINVPSLRCAQSIISDTHE